MRLSNIVANDASSSEGVFKEHTINRENANVQTDIRNFVQLRMDTKPNSSSRMVDAYTQFDQRERQLGPVGSSYTTMAQFLKSDAEGYHLLAEEIEKIGRPFFNYFNGETVNHTGRYISDVFLYRGRRELNRIMEILCNYGRSRRNGMFGYSVESDHVHIIHDCTYSGRNCRCTFKEKIEPFGEFGPNRKYNKPIHQFTRTDWYDVFIYFFLTKRGPRDLWFRGKNWQIPADGERIFIKLFVLFCKYSFSVELVRWQEIYHSRRKMVGGLEDSGSDSDSQRQTNKRTRRTTSSSIDNAVHGKKPRLEGKYSYIKSQTKTLLLKYYCSPISSIRDVKEFRDDPLLSDPKNRDYLQAAFDDFGKDINDLSLRGIYELLNDHLPIFMRSMNYANREESLNIIDQLIRFQCDDDDERICVFLTALVDILDKKIPKCNCIAIQSPPSGGKNFFFDMILALLLNYGQLGMANRHNMFAFQEAPNKRVILWNEPNYEPILTDTIKMMMAGDPYTVKVKHSMDAHVSRTPVIVLTNHQVGFMYEGAFKDRVINFRWKTAPFLKNYDYKPYPLAFFDLLNKYNIIF